MSIAEFSAGMRSHALKAFRTAKIAGEHANPLYYITSHEDSNLRSNEQQKSKTSFLIDKSTISKIRETLIEDHPNIPDVETLYKRARSSTITKPEVKTFKKPDGSTETAFIYKAIEFKNGIDSLLKEIFNTGNKKDTERIRNTLVGTSGIYDKGHVIGLATNLLSTSRNKGITTNPENEKGVDTAIQAINLIIEDLKKFDIESSNYKSEEIYNIFGNYTKSPNKYLVELQISKENRVSGSRVGNELAALRKSLRVSEEDVGNELVKNLNGNSIFSNSLLYMKGSPSMLELIQVSLLEALGGPTNTKKTYQAKDVNITKIIDKIHVDKSKLRNSLLRQISKLEQAKVKLKKDAKDRIRNQYGQYFSMTNIHILIQARLADQIKENMGDGTRRDILNLRSGRFAETVTIQRPTFNKYGSLEIFYNYMKYPYATFAPGGAQSRPSSRDPNILISKSIREIASTLVSNRLKVTSI